ncbi:hypothetical protein H7J70_00810 [Mycolicibacterium celeriflavum]|uniref:Uncharacterized protein n=1 Tax=Mycolicibacterium celeriflavum TaxID=1249101 RepID=A0A1X0BNC4_MYCCF|nr:hypothetical protein [Mycolicibacterium celeriflavum]ORA43831.1 hypothetical protein BST21_21095 [Mycolicibacterium celeriflavum]BBY43791.1 hypothetical protein MCEL_20860 [Mycolicibacterium celeriflavum]
MYHGPTELRSAETGTRDAVRFAIGILVAGAVLLFAAVVWVSTCQGATADSVACGAPQRTVLALAAPAVLLAGGLRGLLRSHQTWRRCEMSWSWLAAGWLLLTAMLLVVTTSTPVLAGTAVFGG